MKRENRRNPEGSDGATPKVAPIQDNPAETAERCFVGSMLWLESSIVLEAARHVWAEDIADPQIRAIFATVVELAENGLRPEPALIVPQMRDRGLSPQHYPTTTRLVSDLSTEPASPNRWPIYATAILQESALRQVREGAQRLAHPMEGLSLQAAVMLLIDLIEVVEQVAGRIPVRGDAA